ncbi:MAG: tetratricopeptide repeat protein, partial [Cyanobacteria bacterium P01_C01_bin.147]
QVTPTTIMGQLDENSEILYESSRFNTYTFDGPVDIIDYFNIHTFEGNAGESIIIELTSEAFDTYLILQGPSGQSLAQGGDYDGLGARIVITLPTTGMYQILAKSYDAGETGRYTLTWQPTTADYVARTTAPHQTATELLQAGQYREAISLAEEHLTTRRERYSRNTQLDQIALYSDLRAWAELYQRQGLYWEAEILYIEALAIVRELYKERSLDERNSLGVGLSNLATLYVDQGRYGEAESLYQEALNIFRAQFGERAPNVASGLNSLALLYQAQGRDGEAEPLYQEALAIRREQLGARHPSVATSLNNLAGLYSDQGRYAEAEPLYQEALAIRREQLGERHPSVARSLNNLAVLYQAQGRYGDAETRYEAALAIGREHLGERHPNIATSLNNLAGLYEAQGRHGEAIPTLQAGLAIEEWNLESNLATLTEVQRQDYAAFFANSTDSAISLSLQIDEAVELGLTTLLRRKGRLLEAGSSSLQRLLQNLIPEDEVVLDELVTVQQQLATLTFNPPANVSPEAYRAEIAQLETRATELEKTLAQRSAIFQAETTSVEVVAVQAQLPADGVLVEYARYFPFDAQAGRANHWGNPRYVAYLLFSDGHIEAVDLGDAAAIDTAVQSFVRLLQNRSAEFQRAGARPTAREAGVEQVTDNIKELVFDPIAPYLQDTDHLFISPDGQLNLLPFEALQTEAGGEYLV